MSRSESAPLRWSAAMDRALYGPQGFYLSADGAPGHFRTSVSASNAGRVIFAGAVAELLDRTDVALGRPDPVDLVEVGAGSGELIVAVLPSLGSGLAARVRPTAVEVRPRPADLPAEVHWHRERSGRGAHGRRGDRPDAASAAIARMVGVLPEMDGLLIANEWLDNVPVDVVVNDRVLLVDDSGSERAGPPPGAAESAWLTRWWPNGGRREIGLGRDLAWAAAIGRLSRGLAVAIDYAHTAADRPPYGTLTGFRRGRETDPVPDGARDLTAHVAIDAVAAAGGRAARLAGRGLRSLVVDQRRALRSLGVDGRRPDYAAEPGRYAEALQRASDSADLLDPGGLGGFAWLLQGIDLDPTAILG